ncbi:MAG: hypothetical protein KKC76_11290 [Proteobacteria bacterium]|nr:hypothetical protein [Pseudomonadota bacterium]MBU4296450.1 hypothetical protein [Pseudomonadota bacterium]MCG2748719.1 hypothetical protein [Desulfobulbaceae bacterium]
MKPSALPLLLLLLCLAACTTQSRMSLPELTVIQDETSRGDCTVIFPQGRWQFTHAIDFSLADGSGTIVIGVTSLDGDELACVLMTIEGFTLFEAIYREGEVLEVRRAAAPFDKPAFAEGLMHDVLMIFQTPAAEKVRYGHLADNTPVCRFTGDDGWITDIMLTADGCWQINAFTPELTKDRSLVGRSCRSMDDTPIPAYLELQNLGRAGYTLKMRLISAENLNR